MSVTLSGLAIEDYNTAAFEVKDSVIDVQFNVNAWQDGYKEALGDGNPRRASIKQWTEALSLYDHSDPTELTAAQNGFDEINWNTRRTMNDAFLTWTWWLAEYPIALSKYEQLTHGKGSLDLAKQRMANVIRAAMRRLEKNQLAGGQLGHTALYHWNGVDDTAGLAEAAAFGAQAHSVGGVLKGAAGIVTAPALQNQWIDGANSVNSRGIMAATLTKARFLTNAPTSVGKKRFGVSTAECYAAFAQLDGTRVLNSGDPKTATIGGAEAVIIGGVPVKPSPYMPTAGTYTTATPISMYWFTPEDHPFVWLGDQHFKIDPWVEVRQPQHLLITSLSVGGQQTVESLASMALFTKFQAY